MQDIEGELEDLLAVFLREIGDRADQARARTAQLLPAFRRGVVADDGAGFGAAGFLECAQRAEGAGIVDCAHRDAPCPAGAEVLAPRFEAVAEPAVAVDIRDAAGLAMVA